MAAAEPSRLSALLFSVQTASSMLCSEGSSVSEALLRESVSLSEAVRKERVWPDHLKNGKGGKGVREGRHARGVAVQFDSEA